MFMLFTRCVLAAVIVLSNSNYVNAQSGNFGIGTTSPTEKLHVVGRGFITEGLTTNGNIHVNNFSGNPGLSITNFGNNYAINAESVNSGTTGIYGKGQAYGMQGIGGATGVYGTGTSYGIHGKGFTGVYGESTGGGVGVRGVSITSGAPGVVGQGTVTGAYGVSGYASDNGVGVYGSNETNGYGVLGGSQSGDGVYGVTNGNSNVNSPVSGVYGYCSGNGIGIRGFSQYGASVVGYGGGTYAGLFYGNVYSSGNYLGSDSKLKKNVSGFSNALTLINQLKPKEYEYREDGNYKLMNLPKGKHFGLIAQEVEQVFPALVKETSFNTAYAKPTLIRDKAGEESSVNNTTPAAAEVIDFKAVNYTELIPVMIKAMQELTEENRKLQQQVDELKAAVNKLSQVK